MDYWYRKVQEKKSPKYRRSVRLVGAYHIALGKACLGAYPGVGAFHSSRQNGYLGAYPGYYGNWRKFSCSIHNVHCTCIVHTPLTKLSQAKITAYTVFQVTTESEVTESLSEHL